MREWRHLGSTTVCDTCHSPDGSFDGVDDSTIGAKANWDNGAYNDEPDDDTLRPGKEKWCVGCHDAGTSEIDSVSAPDIGGDDTTYGYFVNGHGKSGFSKECTDCHDTKLLHTDGISRTFSDDYSVAKYNDGYRLIHTETQPALKVPRSGSSYDPDDFTLCFSCHNELDVLGVPADYQYYSGSLDPAGYVQLPAGTTPYTNFRNEEEWGQGWSMAGNGPSNAHWDHVSMSDACWDIDYDITGDSRQSCVTCHNPHGTKDGSNNPTVKMTRGDMDITFAAYNDGIFDYDYGYIVSDDYLNWPAPNPNPDLSCWACHSYGAGADPDGGTRYYRLPWRTPADIAASSAGGFDSPASLWDDSTSSGSTIADANQWVSFDLGASYLVSEVRLFASSTITSQWDVFVSTEGSDWGTAVETTWQVGGSGGTNCWYGTSVTNKQGRYIKLEGSRTNGSSSDLAIFEFDFLYEKEIIYEGSHTTHTCSNSKDPDTPMACEHCHDTENIPLFGATGAAETLTATTVCDACHSPGGAYNGVENVDDSIGAKNNWNDVYDDATGEALLEGKEKWCLGCHDDDDVPSVIAGVSAPNIVGDGINYGYFVNGHGKNGFDRKCTDCHDLNLTHIDGIERTFSVDYSVAKYNEGYRLIHTETQPALKVPRTGSYDANDFTLCFSCHNELDVLGVPADYQYFNDDPAGYGLQLSAGTTPHTNFRNEEGWGQGWSVRNGPSNAHWDHVNPQTPNWDIDYDGLLESGQSCVTCHNPHGTKDGSDDPTVKMTRGDMDITFAVYSDGVSDYNYGYIGSDDYHKDIAPDPDLSCWACHEPATYGAGADPDGGTRYYRLPWQTPDHIEDRSTDGFDNPNSLCDDSTSSGSTIADGSQWVSFDLGASYLVSEVRLFASSSITSQWDVYVSTDGIDWGAEVETTWQVGSDSGGANRWYGTSVTNKEGRYIKLQGERTNGSSSDKAIFEFDFLCEVPWMTPVSVDSNTDFTNPENMIDDDFDTGSGLDYVVEEAQEVPSTCTEHVGDGDDSATVFYLDHGQVVVGPGNYPNVMINWEEQLRGTVYDLDFENGEITFNTAPAPGATIDACYYYLTDGVLPADVVFDMGDTYTVDYVRLYGHNCSLPDLNTVWDIHVSLNSAGPWTAIITGWTINNSQNYWYVHANDENPGTSGRYIKLTGGIISNDPEIMLKEFQFHTE